MNASECPLLAKSGSASTAEGQNPTETEGQNPIETKTSGQAEKDLIDRLFLSIPAAEKVAAARVPGQLLR
ncbi:MAG: hypothetical protein IH995_03580 [Proteobacteria bacterium]|nr:hypothetical protein [Pseudomonadota bacterium]